jgi:Flp pilus assembly protein TadB
MDEVINFFRRLFGINTTPTVDPPNPADPCNAPACVDAKKRLDGARGRFKSICEAIQLLQKIGRILQQFLAIPIWIIAALIVIAVLLGGLVAVIIWAFIGIYAFCWFLSFVLAAVVGQLAQELAKVSKEITDAIAEVVSNCAEQCRGDLSIPQCLPG